MTSTQRSTSQRGGSGDVNKEHEVRLIETASRKPAMEETPIKCEDIFKPLPGQDQPLRTIMTTGVAGIGKTILTHKFTLDWAEGKANQDIHFTFPFTFRELNLLKGKEFSLVGTSSSLLYWDQRSRNLQIRAVPSCLHLGWSGWVSTSSGLPEQPDLDWCHSADLSGRAADKPHQGRPASLRSHLDNHTPWGSQSDPCWVCWHGDRGERVHRPTEGGVLQEEIQWWDAGQENHLPRRRHHEASTSCVTSQSSVGSLLQFWRTSSKHPREEKRYQRPVTQMYSHFLKVQSIQADRKYHGRAQTDPHWSSESREIIVSLGKLAFNQLEKGNLIFYEADLAECGIDIRAASVYSGVFTQIFKEECGLYQDQVFCFVHLSIQEFLAALYVFLSFINTGDNLLSQEQPRSMWSTLC